MTNSTLQPALPLAGDGAALARVLDQAEVGPGSLVHVTGPAGPTAMIWLGRHGYERAIYVPASHVATAQSADVLLVPHSCALHELAELLRGGDGLRDGGVLIVQTALGGSAGGERFAFFLQPLGFQVEHHISDRGREIYIARRLGVTGFRKAA